MIALLPALISISRGSERELKSELQLARITHRVYRSEARVGLDHIHPATNTAERRMVQDVERLEPELVMQPLKNGAILEKGEVPVFQTRSPYGVSSGIPKRPRPVWHFARVYGVHQVRGPGRPRGTA